MKNLKIFTVLIFFFVFVFSTSFIVVARKDNGKHYGWFKNPDNPSHHHKSMNHKNPGGKSTRVMITK